MRVRGIGYCVWANMVLRLTLLLVHFHFLVGEASINQHPKLKFLLNVYRPTDLAITSNFCILDIHVEKSI